MVIAAVGHAGAHIGANSIANAPSGMGGDYNGEILLLLVSSAGIIFIDHARAGNPQPGNQYAALGIVGFIILFIGQFAPEIAFAFTILLMVSIIFNAPNGLPFISNSSPTKPTIANTGASATSTGTTTNTNTGTTSTGGFPTKAV